MTEEFEKLKSMILDIDNRISALENDRSPDALHNKLQFMGGILEEHTNKISQIENLITTQDENNIEEFTAQELLKWYRASGLFVSDVQNFINDPKISANGVLNGNCTDKYLISRLGKWFRTRAIKRNTGSGL